MVSTLLIGIIILAFALILRYWINRRRFYRRSMTGAEGFSSYEKSVIIKFIELIGKLIAYLLIIFGILFIWSYFKK
ncbi:molybdenum ABC transporter permease [Elizabethkingia anophelis]|nr:molybdenum ABC transporter permease [Elizabethkingia anophelis]